MSELYDIIVVGAGHAGCEAAAATAKMGCRTLLLTISKDTIAKMSCNPAIGGLAKGQIVREIDALGGLMGLVTDVAGIQFRMLNTRKGPAVQAPRAQCDRDLYHKEMRRVMKSIENLEIIEGNSNKVLFDDNKIKGVKLDDDREYYGKCVILTTGTFLNGLIHIGEKQWQAGRKGEPHSTGISESLAEVGFTIGRLKTGTPARIDRESVDYSKLGLQPGEVPPPKFSFRTEKIEQEQLPCYSTYTTPETHKIIQDNLLRSPVFNGQISGTGPRYCPSIEDKIHRFEGRDAHHVILEPEGYESHEFYLNGLPTSLPEDVQDAFIHTIPGLENCVITQMGYAIEYDFVPPYQVKATLETKRIEGLFLAGQINGTSGYEEAGGQGLIAGINAALKVKDESPFVLDRTQAYIGVLIDDLITKSTEEPYRMFTSRAEHRLLLRQDNADLRLAEFGYKLGILPEEAYKIVQKKKEIVENVITYMKKKHYNGKPLNIILRQPENKYEDIVKMHPKLEQFELDPDTIFQIEVQTKYEGYINRALMEIDKIRKRENMRIPIDICYEDITSMSNEAKTKLNKVRPETLGQANRISGVTPADISILMVYLHRQRK